MRQLLTAKMDERKGSEKKLFHRTAFSEFVESYIMAMFAVVVLVHIL